MSTRVNVTYSSCNCWYCRASGSSREHRFHKVRAHRLFRRLSRAVIRAGRFDALPHRCPGLYRY